MSIAEDAGAILTQSFQEHSVAWLVISGIIGGIIGSFFKFLFEQILGPRFEHKRKAKVALAKYSYPLLRAADTLDKRFENLFNTLELGYFDDKEDDYYRLSTLYLFGCFLGWCKILENEAFIEFETARKERAFYKTFYRSFQGFTSFKYFMNIDDFDLTAITRITPPRLVLTAIGELMILKREVHDSNVEVLSFIEFNKQYKSSDEFRRWFSYLENMLSNLTKKQDDIKWNRVVTSAIFVRALVHSLDPHSRRTSPRKIAYLSLLHPDVAQRVKKDLMDTGYKHIIEWEEPSH